jgi:ABC-type glycerol-3-phosphate transport system permease component
LTADLVVAASVIAVLPVVLLFVFLCKAFIGELGQVGSRSR